MGAYDFEEICGDLTLCLANKSEEFIAIGGRIRSVKIGEVMFCDERGTIYSFSQGDAQRTMVSKNSKNVLIRIDGAPRIPLSSLVECATDLIAEVGMGTLYPLSRGQPSVNIMSPPG